MENLMPRPRWCALSFPAFLQRRSVFGVIFQRNANSRTVSQGDVMGVSVFIRPLQFACFFNTQKDYTSALFYFLLSNFSLAGPLDSEAELVIN